MLKNNLIITTIKYMIMAETKKITTLYVVTDTENSYDSIGDIDGGLFDEEWLENHIKQYGADGLYRKLASMSRQISNMDMKVSQENDKSENIVNKND
jgi:hypothetical protein